MMKFLYKSRGAISIFLVLILLPVFTLAGLVVDGARISGAKTTMSGAGDLTMNAALSEYNEVLKDVYGLFAMSDSIDELEQNVSRYFTNTVNNVASLEKSDSYTRSFINSISSLFSTDEVKFDNIIDTRKEDFHLVAVSNSALGNPTVLERQILEYMKYRGPINLGVGLLTKLGCIGETSKQTKAIESKVEYEQKLNTVQEACEAAYKRINEFNKTLEESKFNSEDYKSVLQNDIKNVKADLLKMLEYLYASESPSFKVDSISLDDNLLREVRTAFGSENDNEKAVQAYEWIKKALSYAVEFKKENGEYKIDEEKLYSTMPIGFFENVEDDLLLQIGYVLAIKDEMTELQKWTTLISLMKEFYNKMDGEHQSEFKKEIEAYQDLFIKIFAQVEIAKALPNQWKQDAQDIADSINDLIYEQWDNQAKDLVLKLNKSHAALGTVLEKIEDLKTSREAWGGSIDNLSDNDIKTSMQGDYENSAKDINQDAVKKLQSIILNNAKSLAQVIVFLDSLQLNENKICVETGFFQKIEYAIPALEFQTEHAVKDYAKAFFNSKYASLSLDETVIDKTLRKFTGQPEDEQFYLYLKNTCSEVSEDNKEAKDAKDNAKNRRKELIDKANGEEKSNVDVSSNIPGSYVGEGGVAAAISEAIGNLADGVETSPDAFNPKSVSTDKDQDMENDAKTNLSRITILLDGLANVAKTAKDAVYLEEYFTEMFSCYTSGLDTQGKLTKIPFSLSNRDMSKNVFYRSEVEYILWGKGTPKENLETTKLWIFGVRFALNSIFAFTDQTTRGPALTAATAIAGWTGFGVPIVQSVILLVWSLAESAVDVHQLCEGKDVAVYKSKETWQIGWGGLKEKLEDYAEKVVDDVFNKIENLAVDGIGQLTTIAEEQIEKTREAVVGTVKNTVTNTVERLAIQLIGESNYNLTQADITERLEKALSTISSENQGDSAINNATRIVLSNLTSISVDDDGRTVKEYLSGELYSLYQKAKEGTLGYVGDQVEKLCNNITEPIENKAKEAVSKLGDKLTEKVQSYIAEGGDLVKEKVSGAIGDFIGETSGSKSGSASMATGFTLNYKEYVKAFVLINMAGNKTSMLKRCAELIQVNVQKGGEKADSQFDISKAYTMVQINATVSIRTTFFNIPVATGVDENGNSTYELDFSRLGSDRIDIKYVGIMGY